MVPMASALVTHAADPEESATFLHRTVEPRSNVTVPVGVPPGPLTWLVSVTGEPKLAGLAELANVVVVAAAVTVSLTAFDVEPPKLAEPLVKAAVNEALPTGSVATLQVATPPDVATALQSAVVPLEKVTEPLGTPAADLVVAVNVSSAPKVFAVGAAASTVVVFPAVIVSDWVASVNPPLDGGEVRDAVMVGEPALVSP